MAVSKTCFWLEMLLASGFTISKLARPFVNIVRNIHMAWQQEPFPRFLEWSKAELN